MHNDLNLDTGWRIGEESFAELTRKLRSINPQIIVEFGSGASSVRLALEFPESKIYTVEHDPAFAQQTLELQQSRNINNLTILHRPLRWQIHKGSFYQCYALGDFPIDIDAMIIDGPPYFVHFGREACLHQVIGKLRMGGLAILDDSRRPQEQRIIDNWLAFYPKVFDYEYIDVGHGLGVLKKTGNLINAMPVARILANYRALAGQMKISLINGCKSFIK